MNFRVEGDAEETVVSLGALREDAEGWTCFELATEGGAPRQGRARREGREIIVEWEGTRMRAHVAPAGADHGHAGRVTEVALGPETFLMKVFRGAGAGSKAGAAKAAGPLPVMTPMPGRVQGVHVEPGQEVKRGDLLVTLEAMKMQNEFLAPIDGRVQAVRVARGAVAGAGDVLVILEPRKRQ